MKLFASAAVLAATLACGGAHAATQNLTIDFSGDPVVPAPFSFHLDSPGVVNGNCAAAPCLGVNSTGAARLSIESPLTFSLSGFWFQLLGNNFNLVVETSKTGVAPLKLSTGDYGHNDGGQTLGTSTLEAFKDITWVSFLTEGNNNARIDDLQVSWDDGQQPAPIPLPATAALLPLGLGALAMIGRRRRKSA